MKCKQCGKPGKVRGCDLNGGRWCWCSQHWEEFMAMVRPLFKGGKMITEIRCTCGACPVQYEGRLQDGKYFYFRARWGQWQFAIGDSVDDAITQAMMINPAKFARNGDIGEEFAASWMEHEEAERIIRACAEEYSALATRAA